MKIKHLRQIKKKNGKTFYYYDVPLSRPRKLVPLGDNLPKAIQKLKLLIEPSANLIKFDDAANYYFKSKFFKQKSERTQKDYLSYLPPLSLFFADFQIDQILPHHLSQFLELYADTPTQANRRFSLFSVIFNYARRIGLTSNPNPSVGISKFKEKPKTRLISDLEFSEFVKTCAAHDQIFAYEVILLSQLAARKCDAVKLSKADWNQNDHTLLLTVSKTSNKVQIQVGPDLQNTLQYLFINSKKDTFFRDAYSTFNKKFYIYLNKSGLAKFSPHDLRAYAATKHSEEFGIESTQILLSHSHLQTTQIYIRNRSGRKVKTK